MLTIGISFIVFSAIIALGVIANAGGIDGGATVATVATVAAAENVADLNSLINQNIEALMRTWSQLMDSEEGLDRYAILLKRLPDSIPLHILKDRIALIHLWEQSLQSLGALSLLAQDTIKEYFALAFLYNNLSSLPPAAFQTAMQDFSLLENKFNGILDQLLQETQDLPEQNSPQVPPNYDPGVFPDSSSSDTGSDSSDSSDDKKSPPPNNRIWLTTSLAIGIPLIIGTFCVIKALTRTAIIN